MTLRGCTRCQILFLLDAKAVLDLVFPEKKCTLGIEPCQPGQQGPSSASVPGGAHALAAAGLERPARSGTDDSALLQGRDLNHFHLRCIGWGGSHGQFSNKRVSTCVWK